MRIFALPSWVTNDGTQTNSAFSSNLAFTLNGTATSVTGGLTDNLGVNLNAMTANDGYLLTFANVAVTAGDTLVLLARTYTLAAANGFNPQATQTYTGTMFLADGNANRLSANTTAGAVPEPSTWAFVATGAGLLGFAAMRRRVA